MVSGASATSGHKMLLMTDRALRAFRHLEVASSLADGSIISNRGFPTIVGSCTTYLREGKRAG